MAKTEPKKFNPQMLRSLKANGKRQEYRDAGADNLYVVVQPQSGEVSFVVRATIDGKQRKKTLGSFDAISLADARDKARDLDRALRRGDPLPFQIGPAAPAPAGSTVDEAWNLYWDHEASSRKSASEKKRIYERDIKPVIGGRLLAHVTRDDLAGIICSKFQIAKTASNRLHSLLARFFKWCFTQGQPFTKLTNNPMASVVKMFSERNTARKRYLERHELFWWFKSLGAAGEYRPIHELLMRTLCRFSDIMNLTLGEVAVHSNGDPVLIINDPKNGQPHVVYLHPSAVRLLPTRREGAKDTDRVFSPTSRSGKPVDRLRSAMAGLAAAEDKTVPHWQPHDYRRTGVTHLAGMLCHNDEPLVPHHILDRLLGHKESRPIRHYNVYSYYREKKQALIAWGACLDEVSTM